MKATSNVKMHELDELLDQMIDNFAQKVEKRKFFVHKAVPTFK